MNIITRIRTNIQASQAKKKVEKASIERAQMILQALGEAGRDVNILTPEVLDGLINANKQPDKNNYATYAAQIEKIYKMYYAEADYGGEIARGIIDTRASMLCGEGINTIVFDSDEFLQAREEKEKNEKLQPPVDPMQPIDNMTEPEQTEEEEIVDEKKEAVSNFIDNFVKWNKLQGAGLIEIGECTEKEGKVLLVLNPIKKDDKTVITFEIFDFYSNKYDIKRKNGEIVSVTYKSGLDQKTIPINRAVFIQTSGNKKDCVKTPPRIANVLTQIENYSRAKYDLRANNHLFAKTTPFFKTVDQSGATAINNDIRDKKWVVGRGYAGTAEFSYVSQSTGASDSIEKERVMDMKDIATTIGIPIMLMNYPELMSNRATAETMMEMINNSTKKERLLIEDGIKELIEKAMKLAMDEGVDGAIYEPDMFDVNLPLITLDNLKSLIDVWAMLMDKGLVSKKTVQGKIPGINPSDEEKQIQAEKEENIKNNPIIMGAMQEINQPENNQDIDKTKIQSYRSKKNGNKQSCKH
jgi:type II secretory pathway pseudopilin PulG